MLVGRIATGNTMFQLAPEGTEGVWMEMGSPLLWGAHFTAAVTVDVQPSSAS